MLTSEMPRGFRFRFGARFWSNHDREENRSEDTAQQPSTQASSAATETAATPANATENRTAIRLEESVYSTASFGSSVDPEVVSVLVREDDTPVALSRILGRDLNLARSHYHFIWSSDGTSHDVWADRDRLAGYLQRFRGATITNVNPAGATIEMQLIPHNVPTPADVMDIRVVYAMIHRELLPTTDSAQSHNTQSPPPTTNSAASVSTAQEDSPSNHSILSGAPSPPLDSSPSASDESTSFSSSNSSVSEMSSRVLDRPMSWRSRSFITQQQHQEAEIRPSTDVPFVFPDLVNKGNHDFNLFVPPAYVLGPTIGEGEFSKVKMACNLVTNAAVAVKAFRRRRGIAGSSVDEQIMREIDTIKGLQCPNIIKIFDTLVHGDRVFIVMEVMGKGDLRKYINKNGALTERQARNFFMDITNGVSYLHSKNIVHLDLKLENLLLNHNLNVKITDFGCSRLQIGQKRFNTPCGSYAYGAPEVISGQVYDGKKADIWSLGVILYCMFVARLPYSDDGQLADLMWERRRPPEMPSHLLCITGFNLIHHCLTYRPDHRLSMQQVLSHRWMMYGSRKLPWTKIIGFPFAQATFE